MCISAAMGPRVVFSTTGCAAAHAPAMSPTAMSPAVRRTRALPPPCRSPTRNLDQRRLEHDAAIDHPRRPTKQRGEGGRHLGRLRELPQQIDESPERPNEIALVATKRLLYDTSPVVFSGSPAEHGGHESGRYPHRHGQVMVPLDLQHGVGHAFELRELALELRPLLQEEPGHRGIARAGLLDEAGAEGGRLGERGVLQDAAVDHLRYEELVVVAEARDELPLGEELAVLYGAEAFEHGHHPTELLPVGIAEGLQHLPLLAEPSLQRLDALPRVLAPGLAGPGAAVALDGGQLAFGPLRPLTLHQLGNGQPLQLLGEASRPPLPVAREMERRGLPEDPLDVALLHLDGDPVREEHRHEEAVAATVEPADEAEGGARHAAHEGKLPCPRVGRRAALPAAPPARHPVLLELGAGRPVTADLREITARRLEAPRVGHRHLEARHLRLEPANLL